MYESDTMFNERDRRSAAVQLMLSTDQSYDNRTIASTLKIQIWIAMNNRDMPRAIKTKFPATVMVFGVVSREGHIMPPHIFDDGLKVYLDVLKSVVILWCNYVAGGRPWMLQQDSAPAHKSKETQAWLQKEYYDFAPFYHWPPTPPTWTRWTTSFGHMSRKSPAWPPTTPKPAWSPSIRHAPAGACGKGMLPVPDPYRGGDWAWRRLHWIDISSTT